MALQLAFSSLLAAVRGFRGYLVPYIFELCLPASLRWKTRPDGVNIINLQKTWEKIVLGKRC